MATATSWSPSPSRTATTDSAVAAGTVAGQHDHDIVAGRGQRREHPSERALAGMAVGDGPVEAERREPFEVAADGQDLGGAGGAQRGGDTPGHGAAVDLDEGLVGPHARCSGRR